MELHNLTKTCVWRAGETEPEVRCLNEVEFAVFNRDSWDSSVINAIDAALLSTIVHASPAGVPEGELLERAARTLELEADASFLKYSRESLKQMAEVGLICKDITIEDQ